MADLKNQTDNLRLLPTSVEAELSERHKRTAPKDTTHAWLLSLRGRLAEIEEDTPEAAFGKRKQLVGLLVGSISLGKRQEDGRAETRITYPVSDHPQTQKQSLSRTGLCLTSRKAGRLLHQT